MNLAIRPAISVLLDCALYHTSSSLCQLGLLSGKLDADTAAISMLSVPAIMELLHQDLQGDSAFDGDCPRVAFSADNSAAAFSLHMLVCVNAGHP